MDALGKIVMFGGAALFVAGLVIYLLGRAGGGFLPGDIVVRRESFTFVFPIMTMLVVSLVLTVIINLIIRR